MTTACHVTSGSGLRKFQAFWSLLHRVCIRQWTNVKRRVLLDKFFLYRPNV